MQKLKLAFTFVLAGLITAAPASAATLSTCQSDVSLAMRAYSAAAAFAAEGLWGAASSMTDLGNYYSAQAETACAL